MTRGDEGGKAKKAETSAATWLLILFSAHERQPDDAAGFTYRYQQAVYAAAPALGRRKLRDFLAWHELAILIGVVVQAVITEKQAREVTGGRKPLVPVEYETAVKALQACITLDETKYWSDKADALAAWAKIHRNDEAGRNARMLKLHAFRRMGELAGELRNGYRKPPPGARGGMMPGPLKLLIENGLTNHQATAARLLAKTEPAVFDSLMRRPKPPSPETFQQERRGGSIGWLAITEGRGLMNFASYCRHHGDPVALAKSLTNSESIRAQRMVVEASEWLDAFEQALPKTTQVSKAPK